jgi:hypothetical protein
VPFACPGVPWVVEDFVLRLLCNYGNSGDYGNFGNYAISERLLKKFPA